MLWQGIHETTYSKTMVKQTAHYLQQPEICNKPARHRIVSRLKMVVFKHGCPKNKSLKMNRKNNLLSDKFLK